jgi:hypothetical protein
VSTPEASSFHISSPFSLNILAWHLYFTLACLQLFQLSSHSCHSHIRCTSPIGRFMFLNNAIFPTLSTKLLSFVLSLPGNTCPCQIVPSCHSGLVFYEHKPHIYLRTRVWFASHEWPEVVPAPVDLEFSLALWQPEAPGRNCGRFHMSDADESLSHFHTATHRFYSQRNVFHWHSYMESYPQDVCVRIGLLNVELRHQGRGTFFSSSKAQSVMWEYMLTSLANPPGSWTTCPWLAWVMTVWVVMVVVFVCVLPGVSTQSGLAWDQGLVHGLEWPTHRTGH